MQELQQMTEAESRLAELIWTNEPMASSALVQLAAQHFGWKKSTTYTILKHLTEKALFQNQGGTVTSLISREGYDTARSRSFVRQAFGGSLPRFLAAFTGGRALTAQEAEELKQMIDTYREV